MKTVKRITAIILTVSLIILSFCSCKAKDTVIDTISELNAGKSEKENGIDSIGYTIPFLRTDSLNPYKSEQAINFNIATLLYDSLYSVDNSFKANPLIASDCKTTTTSLTVSIRSGLKFTDGSALTANDVVYSFNLAKSSSNYAYCLTNISSASANANTVVFSLAKPNLYEVNNLIFPIIKSGSDKDTKSSDDYSATIPVGSGRYSVASNGNSKFLTVNKERLGGYYPKYNQIGLEDVTEISSISTLFSLGKIDFYTNSFTSGKYERFTGTDSPVFLTNLVYIGINSSTKVLSSNKVRRAIALIINRNDLASIAFAGCAKATSTPFCASFYALKDCTPPTVKCDEKAGISLLEEAGFSELNSSGIRYSQDSALSLTLVVNKDNGFKLSMGRSIQQALKKADINVNLKEYSYADYLSAIKSGSYDLYIGETKLSNSFDLSRFFTSGGGLDYGINTSCAAATAYNEFESGKITMQNFLDAFADDLPIIPIAYRQAITIKSDKITTDSKTIVSDCFYNIDEWTTK